MVFLTSVDTFLEGWALGVNSKPFICLFCQGMMREEIKADHETIGQ